MDEVKVIEKLINDTKNEKLKWESFFNMSNEVSLVSNDTTSYRTRFGNNYFVLKKINPRKNLYSNYLTVGDRVSYELTFTDSNLNILHKFDNDNSNLIISDSNIQRLFRLVELKVSNVEKLFDQFINS
jgi:hypothetical protein